MKVLNASGEVIRQSRNLRGLLDHARRSPVERVELLELDEELEHASYLMAAHHVNGDTSLSPYASPVVCARFLSSRKSWGRIEVFGPPEFMAEYATGRRLL